MKPEQPYADIVPDSADEALNTLVQVLESAYTAPQRPEGLSWTAASRRLPLVFQPTSNAGKHPQRWPAWRSPARQRASWLLVTAAALVLALLGAGVVNFLPHWVGGGSGAPVAYAAINQSVQISNGITLTAVKGYADPKQLVLFYDVHVSGDLSTKYDGGFVSKSTLQGKDVGSVCGAQMEPVGTSIPVFHCTTILHSDGDIAGNTLQVTWHISELTFIQRHPLTPAPYPGLSNMFVAGDWTLQFSIPFHHQVQDPLQNPN